MVTNKGSDMKEIYGDLFKQEEADAICVTTNGYINVRGRAVMGRGCADRAKRLFKGIDLTLAKCIKEHGNVVSLLVEREKGYCICSFPVKPIEGIANNNLSNVVPHMHKMFKRENGVALPNQKVMGWAHVADMDIIKQSCLEIVELTERMGWKKVIIPKPGCGAGELSWEVVKPEIEVLLDDRFYIIDYRK